MKTTLLAVGDVGASRDDMDSMFAGVATHLRAGDVVFGQLETTLSDRGERAPHAKLAMRAPPALAQALARAGFTVMSFAGNHCMDWGLNAFTDSMAHMRAAGVALCGAGETIAQARTPTVVERGDLRVATLAYSSILPAGYAAEHDRPGCAPLRAHTHYEQIEPDQPGTPPRIVTWPNGQDLASLSADVRAARLIADIVLVSLHWGVHFTAGVIADYQPIVAHAAIDAGADMILGHHPHILKGVEFYRGKAIFYSMGNFAIEQPHIWDSAITRSSSFAHLLKLNPHWTTQSAYMLPADTRMTVIVKADLSKTGIDNVRVLPCWVDDWSQPHVLPPDDPRFAQVANYLATLSAEQGFDTRFDPRGEEIQLTAA